MSELGGRHRPVPYGRRMWRRPRNGGDPDPGMPLLRVFVAVVTGLAFLSPLLAYRAARQDLGDADKRITALEWDQKRAEGDQQRLQGLIDDLQGQLAFSGGGAAPLPGVTMYETPVPARTMPLPQPNRSAPRRTLTPTPMPHPSWRPVTPKPRPAAQAPPAPSPTPEPSESSNSCPAATVGDVIPCVLESLPLSVP